METKEWTLSKVYQMALNHQLEGIMFHNKAEKYMAFLGLEHMSDLQHCQYRAESEDLHKTEKIFLNKHDLMLIAQREAGDEDDIIPREAFSTKASSVGQEFKRKALAGFIDQWSDWETSTEKLYAAIAAWCVEHQCSDYIHFQHLLENVCKEKMIIHDLEREMVISGWELCACENIAFVTHKHMMYNN